MASLQTYKEKTSLSDQWKRWIAENKMMNVEDERIINILKKNGIEEDQARQEIDSIMSHPYFQAGTWMAQKLKKLESLLNVYNHLSEQSSKFGTIERRSNITNEEFLENYYSTNRPVILMDIMRNWKALTLWNPEYLKTVCGNEVVEIMTGRDADPLYELNCEKHKTPILFKDYIDMVVNGEASNDYYLVANNFFLKKEGVKRLYDDIEVFPEYLDKTNFTENGSFWFGPAGTITPLHHDSMNILVAQVYGRKQVTLISSAQIPFMYNNIGVYSEVNYDEPNYDRYPLFKKVKPIEVILEPGEALFLPVGWWHHVKALDISITVSFTNFLFPNQYHWKQPCIYR